MFEFYAGLCKTRKLTLPRTPESPVLQHGVRGLLILFCLAIFAPHPAQAERWFSSGFELGSSTSGIEWGTGIPVVQGTTKRSGSYAGQITSLVSGQPKGFGVRFDSAATDGPYYFRVWLRVDTLPSAENRFLELSNWGSSLKAHLTLDNTGVLRIYDNGALAGTSSAITASEWHKLEIEFDRTPAAGSEILRARIDGGSFFGTTTATLNSEIAILTLGGNRANEAQTQGNWYFDDVAVNKNSGSYENTFPGEGKIVHLRPNADGDNAMGSRGGTDSGSDYGQVNEVTPNDATNYYILDVDNDILDLNIDASSTAGINASDTITLVEVGIRSTGSAIQSRSFGLRVKSQSGGTVATSSTWALGGTAWNTNKADEAPDLYTLLKSYTDPQLGGAWTPALLDSAQIGVQAIDAAPDVYISTLWLLVEYVPASGGSQVKTVNIQNASINNMEIR